MVALWYMVHGVHVGETGNGGTDPNHIWEIQGVGDFNGDGKAEILWRATGGQLAIWSEYLYESGRPTYQNIPGWLAPSDWQIAALGDFSGDGRTDIVWRHTTGTLHIWKMSGATYTGGSGYLPVDTAWELRGLLSQAHQRLNLQ